MNAENVDTTEPSDIGFWHWMYWHFDEEQL